MQEADYMDSLPGNILSDKKKKWFIAAFVCINLFLSCYYLDVWITPNSTSRALPVITKYEDHTISIDKYKDFTGDKSQVNGHYYSDKAPLSTMMVYPFYYVYKSLGFKDISEDKLKEYPIYIWETVGLKDGRTFLLPKSSPVFIIGDIICGAVPFVIIVLITFLTVVKQRPKFSPVWLAVLPFYGSFLFAYAGTFTGHLLAGFLLFLGYILLKEKRLFLASGIVAGLAFATEYPIGIIFPIWAVLIYLNEKDIKKVLLFIAGVAPGVLFAMWYNYHVTGSAVTTSYSYVSNEQYKGVSNIGFSYPKPEAIWGLLFTRYRGILIYAPLLIVMGWYVIKQNVKNISNGTKTNFLILFIKNYFWITFLFYILLISANAIWWGGWAFGPRHLIPVTIIVLYEGTVYLSKISFSKYFFYLLSILGVLAVWVDKSTKIYMLPDNPNQFALTDVIIPDFLKHKFNTNLLPVFAFDAPPSLSIYVWPVLFFAGLFFLSQWYTKLFPAPIKAATTQQKQAPKKGKRK